MNEEKENGGREEFKRACYVQWLMACPDLPGKVQRRIMECFPDPEEIFTVPRDRWEEMLSEYQMAVLWKRLRETGNFGKMQEEYERLRSLGISFAMLGQAEYPERLKEIPDAPLGIYYKGKMPGDQDMAVAVIGSRDCSEYGCRVAKALGTYLGECRIPVISGMARGIDGISQQAALEAGGESYGILGCGVDVCYPASNRRLYDTLTMQGGILSTYPPGTKPLARNFPPRNRIVSGLSMAIVVVEAAVKSGTSITVSMALEQGREVYVVPGRITDRLSEGCNQLIKQGAAVYTDPEHFVEELSETFFLQRISPAGSKKKGKKAAMEPQVREELLDVWRALDLTPRSVEEIRMRMVSGGKAEETAADAQSISVRLMELALNGHAKQVSAGCFCRQ